MHKSDYELELVAGIKGIDSECLERAVDLIDNSKCVYVAGNGGSLSTAQHFVVDLMKFCGKSAFTVSNSSLLTMIANDYEYENIFDWQLSRFSFDGVVFGITTSGLSENILKIIDGNKEYKKIVVTGIGGKSLIKRADCGILVPSYVTQIIEDVSLIVCHMIVHELVERSKK